MEKQSLETYFQGKADQKLRARIVAWATASKENSQQFVRAKTDWTFEHFSNELSDADDFNRFSQHADRLIKSLPVEKRTRTINRIYQIAAMIAVPLLLTSAFYQIRLSQQLKKQEMNLLIADATAILPQQTETTLDYMINPGVKGRLLLPDGSEVWLNSHSVLRSPNLFDTINRIVALEGEGYFIIKGSPDWPFYVQTKKGVTIKVVGTEFNLSSYANDPFLKITMIKGSLILIDEASLKTISLRPKEELILPNNNFGEIVRSSAKKAKEDTSWKEGYLMFDNTPIDAVMRKMERWFGVTITINDTRILQYRLTAEFENESLIQVLEMLKISSNIQYQVQGTHVLLDM